MEGDKAQKTTWLVRQDISIHSLRMEGDPDTPAPTAAGKTFQSTPSVWRETCRGFPIRPPKLYFNPLPPYGGRLSCLMMVQFFVYFNPLPPYGGRHVDLGDGAVRIDHFNPLPPYGGRLSVRLHSEIPYHFNPLPPYGGRLIRSYRFIWTAVFQSTPSVWRET